MPRQVRLISALLLATNSVSAFVVAPASGVQLGHSVRVFSQDPASEGEGDGASEEENQGLVLEGLGQEMAKMSTKYSFTESDFLAAARKRAEQKVESSNAGASDEEWKKIAREKQEEFGEIDDWENSKKEAGNADSQILMFTDGPAEDDDSEGGEGGGEQKLLLF